MPAKKTFEFEVVTLEDQGRFDFGSFDKDATVMMDNQSDDGWELVHCASHEIGSRLADDGTTVTQLVTVWKRPL